MNTRIIMTISALILGISGLTLSFLPDLFLNNLGVDSSPITLLLGQIIGGLYFAFAMLNWMSKESLIGGIYNRPITLANLSHFLIVGLAILKVLLKNPDLPILIWAIGIIYLVFGILFTRIFFQHPVKSSDVDFITV